MGVQDNEIRILSEEIVALRRRIAELEGVSAGREPEEGFPTGEQQWRATFDAITDPVCIIDTNGVIVRHNIAMERLLDMPGMINGRRCYEVVHDQSAPIHDCPLVRMTGSHHSETLVMSLGQRWFEVSVDPFFSNSGTLTGGVHIMKDVTERRRAEEQLRRSEERLTLALRGGDLVTWDWDIPTGRTFHNDRWYAMTGYEPGELEEHIRTWEVLVHPEDLPQVMKVLTSHLHGDTPSYECEYRLCHRSGRWLWVLERGLVTQRDDQGCALRACGTYMDITQRRQTEDQRIEMERRMQEAHRHESLGILAGGIAHDFNNLLSVILGNLDLARLHLPAGSPALDNIRKAEGASRRVAEITRQILAFAGQGRISLQDVSLPDLIDGMEDLVAASLPGHITLIKRHTGPQTRIRADSAQIRQIVLNLVVNAWEAMGDTPGTITLTTGVEDCDDALLSRSRTTEKPTAGRYAFLEVADTGSGMDIFTLDRLFDPFFTTKFTGRGLGLPAALGIVQAHKGAITVESEAATGTRFRVYLPVPGVGQASTTGQKRSTSP